MPLLDHFHPPLSDSHHWESLHAAWLSYITESLNRILPKEYYALEQAHVGPSVEIDVATFEGSTQSSSEPYDPSGNGTAVATLPAVYIAPSPTATAPIVYSDDFEIHVIGDRSGRHLVAAIELVSRANKDRPESRRAFAVKCANYLHHGVAVIIIDVVTDRTADLHRETLEMVGAGNIAPVPDGAKLYAVAYRPIRRKTRDEFDVWVEPIAVGSVLPTLRLWLNAVEAVPVELEATYMDACRRRRVPGVA